MTSPDASGPGTYVPQAQLTSRDGSGPTCAYDAADQLPSATPTSVPVTTFTDDNRGERTASTTLRATHEATGVAVPKGIVVSVLWAGRSEGGY
jgi:hypothetical protein